jgi:hypothetical protein
MPSYWSRTHTVNVEDIDIGDAWQVVASATTGDSRARKRIEIAIGRKEWRTKLIVNDSDTDTVLYQGDDPQAAVDAYNEAR